MALSHLQRIKIELLCHGIRIGEMKKNFTRYRFKRASLSEGLYFVLKKNGEETVANLPVFEDFVETSPFFYRDGVIYKNTSPLCEAEIIAEPPWYKELLPDGREFQSILQQHGKDVLAIAISDCYFKREGRGCLFCALRNNGEMKRAEDVEHVIKKLKNEGFYYRELNINSGTIDEKNFGAEIYGEIAKIGKKEGFMVYIQIPPVERETMIFLKESGVDSVSINLEIYNDEIRKKICPGKSGIEKRRYFKALSDAVEVFGPSQVSSWLIIGLEPEEDTMKGIDEIIKCGAIPHPSIFRPLKGSKLENLPPPSPETSMRIYTYLNEKLKKNGPKVHLSKAACVNCGCCSVMG